MLIVKTNEEHIELLEAKGSTAEILADLGAIAGVLLTRLAKNEKDFNQLKEMTIGMIKECITFETL